MSDDVILTDQPLAAALADAAAPLASVFILPEALSEHQQRIADLAVDGVFVAIYNGEHLLKLGRRNINWHDPAQGERLHMVLRMRPVAVLAQAHAITRKAEYAEAAADYMREFMDGFPLDASGACPKAKSTLDVCIRSRSFAEALHRLAPSDAFDDALLTRMLHYLAEQFRFLRENMSTTINWRVHNARDLLFGALHLPFLRGADDWRDFAVKVLNDAWHRQFLPDGVHYERNPVYHLGMTSTFTQLYELGTSIPDLGIAVTLAGLEKAYDFALACAKPNGYLCGLHDSQSEFTGHVRDGKYAEGHKSVDNEKTWRAFREKFDLPLDYPSTSQYFPDAGLGFFRTGWTEDDAWVSFDATRWGGGHCHLGRNSVQLHANRRTLVVDPGWLEYSSNAWGVHGRSTRAHNTCNLNGLTQVQTNPSRTVHHHAPGYEAMFSVYEGGYWDTELKWNFTKAGQGIWAEHARTMFWVQDRFMFIADSMYRLPQREDETADEAPSFEINWQLPDAPELDLAADASRAVAHWGDSNLLLLFPIRPQGATLTAHAGEMDPIRGWLPGDHQHRAAPQLCLNTPRMTRQHDYYVTLLVPYTEAQPPQVSVEAKSPMGTVGHVTLRWADGSVDQVHWGCGFGLMVGNVDDFETDSSLVHLRRDPAGKIVKGCCVDGTYLSPWSATPRAKPETFTIGNSDKR